MNKTDTDDFKARREAELDHLEAHGFKRMTVAIGGESFMAALGGITKAAICGTCWSLVPIADLTDDSTTVAQHAKWHDTSA